MLLILLFFNKGVYSDLYGHAMRQNLPNGPGVCYEKNKNGHFEYKSMMTTSNFSIECIRWLHFMNEQEPFKNVQIQHALNRGEKQIQVGNKFYYVDGYCVVENEKFFFEFNGCRYHSCSCDVSKKSKIRRNDVQKEKDLSSIGTLIVMKECEWDEFCKTTKPEYSLPNFLGRKNIKESEIFAAVVNGTFYGLIQCDISSPDHVIEHFLKLNHPPIFNHVEIDREMLSTKMTEQLDSRNIKFPLEKQLTLTFNATEYLLTTDLAQFYISKGMILSNLKIAIEYSKDQPLAAFVNLVTEKRKEATRIRDNNLQNTYKLCMNSCYGKTGLNLDKLRKHVYVKPSNLSKHIGPRTQHFCPVNGEFDSDYIEVVKKRHRVTDTIPGKFIQIF